MQSKLTEIYLPLQRSVRERSENQMFAFELMNLSGGNDIKPMENVSEHNPIAITFILYAGR